LQNKPQPEDDGTMYNAFAEAFKKAEAAKKTEKQKEKKK
jgi:hypothetical protein